MKTDSSKSTGSAHVDSFRILMAPLGFPPQPYTYSVTTDLMYDYLDVWGESPELDGHRDFIHIRVPVGIKSGSYPLSQLDAEKESGAASAENSDSSVWVYAIFDDGTGLLQPDTGKIDLTWDRVTRKFSATFKFDAKVESRTYHVARGEIDVVVPEAELSNGVGKVSAKITPPLPDGHHEFIAENIGFAQSTVSNWILSVTQRVNGNNHRMRFVIPEDYELGEPLVNAVSYTYHTTGVHGRDMNYSSFFWDKTARTLKAESSFEFTISAVVYRVEDIVVDITY